MKEGKITLSQEQLKTLTVINRFIDKSISRQQAAELFGSLHTPDHTLKERESLPLALNPSFIKIPVENPFTPFLTNWKEAVLKIYSRPEFSNANFLHFKDILCRFRNSTFLLCPSSILKMLVLKALKRKNPDTAQYIGANVSPIPTAHPDRCHALRVVWGNIKYALHGAIDDTGRSSDFS